MHSIPSILSSPIVTGGLILMCSGAVMALLHKLPETFYVFLKRQLLIEVTLLGNDPLFDWTKQYLAQKVYVAKARILSASTKKYSNFYSIDQNNDVTISLGPGSHFLFLRRHLAWILYNRSESQGGYFGAIWHESITIRVLGRSNKILQEILDDICTVGNIKKPDSVSVFSSVDTDWKRTATLRSRPADSLILPAGVLQDLLQDAVGFINNAEWYYKMCIPYRRGYLFHGIPGSGKTTTALVIASALNLSIYIVNLMDKNMGDSELLSLLSGIPSKNSLVLLEDADTAFIRRDKVEENKNALTLSGLLNAIDGIAASEGRLLIITANEPEKLDPALIRPGRIDKKIEFLAVTSDQVQRAFLRFFPEASEEAITTFCGVVVPLKISMAMLQNYLYINKTNEATALQNIKILVQDTVQVTHTETVT